MMPFDADTDINYQFFLVWVCYKVRVKQSKY